MVGNAVCAPVAEWVGRRLVDPGDYDHSSDGPLATGRPWPTAAWGDSGLAHRVELSEWPVRLPRPHLRDFLRYPLNPLSERAALGFLKRAERAQLRFPDGLLAELRSHATMMSESAA
jgi:DNA (cytosine-5)-methyltransferase 1